MNYWEGSEKALCQFLKTDHIHGLSTKIARHRARILGANILITKHGVSPWRIFLRQFASPLVIILLIAAGLSFFKNDLTDSIVILMIVISNAVIGFFQENKARRTIEGLSKLLVPMAVVIRDGIEQKIKASELVDGDLVKLEAGDRVPADIRLVYDKGLRINQAVLTGESMPVTKMTQSLPAETPLLDRTNTVFMSSYIVSGKGYGLVVATGMRTEVGRIANEIATTEEKSDIFNEKIRVYGNYLLVIAFIGTLLVMLMGWWRQMPMWEVAWAALSLLVSVVPEQLPLAITIILSIGLLKMARRKAVIRRLDAVESLGSATTICVDKTGTLTYGQMSVTKIIFHDEEIAVGGDYLDLNGYFERDNKKLDPAKNVRLSILLEWSAFVSRAVITQSDIDRGEASVTTDPTEVAVAVAAARGGYYAFKDRVTYPELNEIPFDQEYRLSATTHQYDQQIRTVVKGAPEVIVKKSSYYMDEKGIRKKISRAVIDELQFRTEELAMEGFRLVCVAIRDDKELKKYTPKTLDDLTLVGVMAIEDQVRRESEKAITEAEDAGVRIVMITGDHKRTAISVAERVGISNVDTAVEAKDLDRINLATTTVIARSTPSDKFKIVDNLQDLGEVVAMTGDGVNDAPALKKADVGIAIGKGGTDIAIESADMVLLNNDVGSIVSAIREGRLIWENLKKIVICLNATSIGELFTVIAVLALGWPLPLVATQILWVNLVTDGLTVLPLAFEKPEENLMKRPPLPSKRPLVDWQTGWRMIYIALLMGIGTTVVFAYYLEYGLAYAQTAALIALCFYEWFALLVVRSATRSIFKISIKTNRTIVPALLGSLGLTVMAVYWRPLANMLHMAAVHWSVWVVGIAIGSTVVWGEEIRKIIVRSWQAKKSA